MAPVTGTASVRATPERLLDLLLDVASYPSWQGGYERVEVRESDERGRPVLVESHVKAMGQRASHTVRYEYPEPGRFAYHLHESGVVTTYDFHCSVTADGDGTSQVSVSQEIELKWPMPKRMLEKMARKGIDGMLAALKERAEGPAE
ncbi:MAG: hypothetical protein HOY71_17285 [Nonomuraea sp.]|nr:hypothetical protein [Nonomuraea sp.]